MGIRHFEDLSIDDIKHLIHHCDSIVATEKLDGAAIAFGFDEMGRLFMSREGKGGERFWSPNEWNHRLFWTTSFRSAHQALEKIELPLKKIIGYPSLVHGEILFGRQPNAIPYNCDTNKLVVFGGVTDSQIRDIKKLLSSKKISVTIPNAPMTQDGVTINQEPQEHVWSISSVSPISKSKIKRALKAPLVSRLMKDIDDLLNQRCPQADIPNHQLLQIKFNRTPDFIDSITWKEQKQSIRLSKLKLESQLLELKKQIKEHLLDSLVRNLTSQFGTVKGVEGVVLCQGGITVKLVDKETFTAINRFNHEYREILNVDIWRPLKKQLSSLTSREQAIEAINQAQTSVKRLLAQYHQEFKSKRLEIQQGNQTKNIHINDAIHERNLQAFAQLRTRLNQLQSVVQHQETFDPQQALLAESLTLISESGHAFGNTDRIPRELIIPTLSWISKTVDVPLQVLKSNLLGSAGKSKTSGDLDIAIDRNMFTEEGFLQLLKDRLGETNVMHSTGLNIIHARIPISGNPAIGHVQTDFMFTDSVEWCRFNFHSDGDASAYKGAYRTRLLSAIAASGNDCEYENDELVSRKGWVWVPAHGLQWQWRQRPLKKNGVGRIKSFQIMQKGRTINDPKAVARILFGQPVPIEQLGRVETIMPLVRKCFNQERQQLISQIFDTAIKECRMERMEIFND